MMAFAGRVWIEAWGVLVESGPYLLFGFFAAGLVHGFVSEETVVRHLGTGRVASVVKAALFGIPLPLCSCGVLPAAANLRKRGASRGAMVSFLISTPETGADSLALSYALLGPFLTILRPVAALITAVVAGTAENFANDPAAERTELPMAATTCGCGLSGSGATGLWLRLRGGLRYGFGDLFQDLAPWLGVGFLVAGLISAALPGDALARFLGHGPLSYLAMLAVGIPLYVCATASTPIAASLILKGLSPGAALVFLLAGPATNAATITALSRLLGVRSTVRYVATIAVVALGMGVVTDLLFRTFGLSAHGALARTRELPALVGQGAALLLVALALLPYLRFRGRPPTPCSGGT
jgi:uncharacterized membrane protein YraQ (UPF0718 family)